MRYRYFVSFTGQRKNSPTDIGNAVILRTGPIETPEDITELERYIREQSGFDGPAVILGFQLMSKVADE